MKLVACCALLLLARAPQDRETCVTAGLRWLIRHQSADGRWSDTDFVSQCRKEDGGPCGAKGEGISDIGATSLALLSFTGAGLTHLSKDPIEGGEAGPEIRKAFEWLMKRQAADGAIGTPGGSRFVEEHALATAALCEAWGMTQSKVFKDPAKKAVDYLLSLRIKGKGWKDPASTGWAVAALRAATLAELGKPDAEIKQAIDSLKPDKKSPTFDRALHLALDLEVNRPTGDAAAAHAAETLKDLKGSNALRFDPYLALVMIVARKRGDPAWNDDRKSLVKTLNESQNGKNADKCLDGSWNPSPQSPVSYGRVTATCYHLLTAQVVMDYSNAFSPSK